MFSWWMALAGAEQPALAPTFAVERVVWARPFTLAQPTRYRHASPARDVAEGWLVELRVDPRAMVPRQIGVPNLWIGEDIAVRTRWGDPSGCAVVWVPGPHDPGTEPIFFGGSILPEQADAAAAAAAREAAGATLAADRRGDIQGEVLELAHLGALTAVADARSDACAR